MDAATPTALRLDLATNRLHVTWADGRESTYDGGYLRRICPCAGCRGHAPGEVEPPSWARCREVRVRGAEAVGGYALRLDLSDGHASGIYSFDWLRENDPQDVPGLDATGRPIGEAPPAGDAPAPRAP